MTRDSATIRFLRRFPAWPVLTVLILVAFWLYIGTGKQFFERVIDTLLGSLLAILTGVTARMSQRETPELPANEETNLEEKEK